MRIQAAGIEKKIETYQVLTNHGKLGVIHYIRFQTNSDTNSASIDVKSDPLRDTNKIIEMNLPKYSIRTDAEAAVVFRIVRWHRNSPLESLD